MQNEPPASHEPPRTGRASRLDALARFRWLLALIAVLLAALAAFWMFGRGAADAVDRFGERAERVAKGFKSGTITEQFIASVPELEKYAGENMEVAVLHATETFSRSSELKVLWDTLSLGTTTTRIAVPVTYRYHIHLNDPWKLEEKGNVCVVHAPPIRATLPPAIRTDAMSVETSTGWARRNATEQLRDTVKMITPRVSELAEQRARGDFTVRHAARQKVGEFVRDWILKDPKWREEFRAVVVVFPDDPSNDAASAEGVPVQK